MKRLIVFLSLLNVLSGCSLFEKKVLLNISGNILQGTNSFSFDQYYAKKLNLEVFSCKYDNQGNRFCSDLATCEVTGNVYSINNVEVTQDDIGKTILVRINTYLYFINPVNNNFYVNGGYYSYEQFYGEISNGIFIYDIDAGTVSETRDLYIETYSNGMIPDLTNAILTYTNCYL